MADDKRPDSVDDPLAKAAEALDVPEEEIAAAIARHREQQAAEATDKEAVSEHYSTALKMLRQGLQPKQIVRRLVKRGLSYEKATKLAYRVREENADVLRTNANILLGTALFLLGLGALLLVNGLLNGGGLNLFSLEVVLLIAGVGLLVQALYRRRTLKK